MREGLPKGWVEAPITEISHIVYGKGLLQNKLVENGKFPVFGANSIIGYYNDYLYEKPQILISCRGANSGVINISPPKCYVTSNSLVVELPYKYYECLKFLFYSLKSSDKSSVVTGTAQPQVTIDNLNEFFISLPPLNEQKRIVAKLDAIMPRIEAVKERLYKVPGILKRFRQSVLTAAVTGRLTEQWREEHPEAEKWEETNIEDLADYITSGSRGWAEYYSDEGAIFVRTQNINTDELILDDVAYVKLPKNTEGTRTKIEKYDLLVTITGANVTKTALVKNEIREAYVNQHIALVRLKNNENAFYIHLWLVAPNAGRSQLEDAAYGAGKPGLNLKNIKDVAINLPPLEEQKEIVRQVEKLFALADKVEAHYQKAKARVDKLSQSVLAKAFRGELVPQDSNDEPAEKLLERILEEKAKMEAELKGGRKKVARNAANKRGGKS